MRYAQIFDPLASCRCYKENIVWLLCLPNEKSRKFPPKLLKSLTSGTTKWKIVHQRIGVQCWCQIIVTFFMAPNQIMLCWLIRAETICPLKHLSSEISLQLSNWRPLNEVYQFFFSTHLIFWRRSVWLQMKRRREVGKNESCESNPPFCLLFWWDRAAGGTALPPHTHIKISRLFSYNVSAGSVHGMKTCENITH